MTQLNSKKCASVTIPLCSPFPLASLPQQGREANQPQCSRRVFLRVEKKRRKSKLNKLVTSNFALLGISNASLRMSKRMLQGKQWKSDLNNLSTLIFLEFPMDIKTLHAKASILALRKNAIKNVTQAEHARVSSGFARTTIWPILTHYIF